MVPELGKRYSRSEIASMLGGGIVPYLPTRDGVVVCGCFKCTPRWNPGAPEEVVFGLGPLVRRAAELVAEQANAIPVFLFRANGAWEHVGSYQCTGLRTDVATCRRAEKANPARGEICGVLSFKRVR